jgi:hypothetical protein
MCDCQRQQEMKIDRRLLTSFVVKSTGVSASNRLERFIQFQELTSLGCETRSVVDPLRSQSPPLSNPNILRLEQIRRLHRHTTSNAWESTSEALTNGGRNRAETHRNLGRSRRVKPPNCNATKHGHWAFVPAICNCLDFSGIRYRVATIMSCPAR